MCNQFPTEFTVCKLQYLVVRKGVKIDFLGNQRLKGVFFSILEVTKVLTKIAKVNGCEAVAEWIKPCTSHLFWSARTTRDGNGDVIWAKFSSFLSHIIDEHENLENPLFNKCAHKDITQPRKWLDKGIHRFIIYYISP